jgi:hypothetical protein
MHRVFVFGTLKKGFPLHWQGFGDTPKRLDCRAVERFPMFIAWTLVCAHDDERAPLRLPSARRAV